MTKDNAPGQNPEPSLAEGEKFPSLATSPSDLIDLDESLQSRPATWAFRGQTRKFGTLLPSFSRIFTIKKSVGTANIIEWDLIEAFRQHYEKLEGRTPEMPSPARIARRFDLACLSVMQHYGVPTRLLDWTSDFWTAIYFACAGDPNEDAEIWIYDREIFKEPNLQDLVTPWEGIPPFEPEFLSKRGEGPPIIELDLQLTPRMKQQKAHHTVSSDIFADHGPLLSALDKKTSKTDKIKNFYRVDIASGCKEKALRFLEEHKKMTASSIFPDVEGLGRFLRWHLDTLVTMLL
jgi:hypothetical protein